MSKCYHTLAKNRLVLVLVSKIRVGIVDSYYISEILFENVLELNPTILM